MGTASFSNAAAAADRMSASQSSPGMMEDEPTCGGRPRRPAVRNPSRRETRRRTEAGFVRRLETEDEVIELKEGPGDGNEPEHKECKYVPRPQLVADLELSPELALPIETNYHVTLQFDVRIMKLLKKYSNAVYDTNVFHNRGDVLTLFANGKRHDAMGTHPVLAAGPNGYPLPMDREDFLRRVNYNDQRGGKTFTNMSYAEWEWEAYRFQREFLRPIVLTAWRCGFTKRKFERIVDVSRDAQGPGHTTNLERAALHEKLEVISFYFRRLLKQTFDCERYSYTIPPTRLTSSSHRHIDIGPLLYMERSGIPIEIIVACCYYSIRVPPMVMEKLDRYNDDVVKGKWREPLKDYIGHVASEHYARLKNTQRNA